MEIENLLPSLSSDFTIIHDMMTGISEKNKVPHEWIFIELFLSHLKDVEMAIKFIAFVGQYFKKYIWKFVSFGNPYEMVLHELMDCNFTLIKYYKYNFVISQKELNHAIEFGAIITKFCIQYLNYSLINCGGERLL